MLKLPRHAERHASSATIAVVVVDFDMREMYLKDISLIGLLHGTFQCFQT